MKRVLSVLLIVVMLVPMLTAFSITSNAEIVASGKISNLSWVLEDNGLLTISGSGTMGTYTSASSYPWYSRRASITSINIVEGVTAIGKYAFSGCSAVTDVYIPNSVTTINSYAFSGCTSLTEIYIPETVSSMVSSAFNNCPSLVIVCERGSYAQTVASNYSLKFRYSDDTTVYVKIGTLASGHSWALTADGTLTITGQGAISNYNSTSAPWYSNRSLIKKVVLSSNCTGIGNYAFNGCTALEEIVIPSALESIGNSAFRSCSALKGLTLPETLTSIGTYAFYGCTSLSAISLPEGISDIKIYTFYGCSALESIYIPDSVSVIGAYAFCGCSSLAKIDIPDAVTVISENTFKNCTSLTSVFIPDAVTSIYSDAFDGCDVELICNKGTDADLCLIKSSFVFKYADSDRVYIQSNTMNSSIEWRLTDDGILEIDGSGEMPYYSSSGSVPWYNYRTSIKSVEISDGITSICNYAFYGFTALESITIPDTVVSMGTYVFKGCTSLTSVNLSSSLESIGAYAFQDCTKLTGIELPDTVSSIGKYAFYSCISLEAIEIPDAVTSILGNTFQGCEKLAQVTLPNELTSILASAFYNCTSLKEIYIPESVSTIDSKVFYGISDLVISCVRGSYASRYAVNNSIGLSYTDSDRVYIKTGFVNNNITYLITDDGILELIGQGAMSNYTSATSVPWYSYRSSIVSVEISDSITSISPYAFYGFSAISQIEIPDSITSLGSNAFNSCSSLKEITIPDSVTNMGTYLFNNCTSLEKAVIGGGVTTVTGYMFNNCTALERVDIPVNVTSVVSTAFNGCSDFIIYCEKESYACEYALEKNIVYLLPDGTRDIIDSSVSEPVIWTLYSDKELVIMGEGEMENFTDGKPYWHENMHRIETVRIIGDITHIGVFAFNEAPVKTVYIPSTVKSIGNYAFHGCSSLIKVVTDSLDTWMALDFAGYTANPLCYGASLYFGNELVSDIVIPEGSESIGDYKFYNYTKLNSLTIPSSVKYIGTKAFYGAGSNITVNVDSIDRWLDIEFADTDANPLNTPYVKLNVNGKLIESVTLDRAQIPDNAFPGYGKLKSVVLKDTVRAIGENAFANCSALASVTIPYSVTTISDTAFAGVEGLTIICSQGSYAEEYAIAKGIAYNVVSCEHSFTNYTSDNNGSCTENGTMTAYCDNGCGFTNTVEEPDSLRHPYELQVLLAPTCQKTGAGINICECGARENVILGKTEHIYTEYVSNNDATCMKEGTETAYCDYGCGNTDTVTIKGVYVDHSYTQYTFKTEPTCTSHGIEYAECDYGCGCFDMRIALGTMIDHSFTNYVSNNDGDCYNDGTMTAYCDYGCNNTDTVTEPDSKVHNYEFYTVTTQPTCMAEGKGEYSCQCSANYSVTVPIVDHRYSEYIFNDDSTCMTDGSETAHCDYGCGNTDTRTAEGTVCGHVFGEYVYNGDATCTADGTETALCIFGCQSADTRAAADTMLDHTYETEIVKEADCESEGVILYICSCNDYYYDIIPIVPHTWGGWIITTVPTADTTGISTRVCDVCGLEQTKELTPKEMILPVVSIDNYILSIENGDSIKDIRYAEGVYTTPNQIKTQENNVAISNVLVKKYTVDGVFVYEMPKGGYFTAWIRMTDGGEYIVAFDVTHFTPSVTAYGVKVTLHDLYDVKDFYIAKGEYNTYREIKDNGYIVSVTGAKIAGKHDYTYTVYEPGMHTILIRYNDGTTALFHEELTVDEPVFTTNGLQVTVSNLPDVKVIRTAYGEWSTVKDLKATNSIRNFSAKTAIKGKDPYTIQYREEGMVTIIVEYNNGYQKVFHYEVTKKTPTMERNGNTIIFGELDGLVMVRYAVGSYTTSSQIKNAAGSKALKPADLVNGYAVVSGLASGTYTFCVQYDDESYNYYIITVE